MFVQEKTFQLSAKGEGDKTNPPKRRFSPLPRVCFGRRCPCRRFGQTLPHPCGPVQCGTTIFSSTNPSPSVLRFGSGDCLFFLLLLLYLPNSTWTPTKYAVRFDFCGDSDQLSSSSAPTAKTTHQRGRSRICFRKSYAAPQRPSASRRRLRRTHSLPKHNSQNNQKSSPVTQTKELLLFAYMYLTYPYPH